MIFDLIAAHQPASGPSVSGFVAASTAFVIAGASLVVNYPPESASGDTLVVLWRSQQTLSPVPSGWTQLNGDARTGMLTRVRGAETSMTIAPLSSGDISAICVAYRGGNIVNGPTCSYASGSGEATRPNQTVAANVIISFGIAATSTTMAFSTPAGMTKRAQLVPADGVTRNLVFFDELRATSGETGVRISTLTPSISSGSALAVAANFNLI